MAQKSKNSKRLSPNGSLEFWKVLRIRFGAYLITKGIRIFLKESIVPKKYYRDQDVHDHRLMSYIFASKVLATELDNSTFQGTEFLVGRKVISISIDNPVFSMYLLLMKCLGVVYGDAANIQGLNDAIFLRGIATLYDDLSGGDVPILTQLPYTETLAMKKVREAIEQDIAEESQLITNIVKESPNVVN